MYAEESQVVPKLNGITKGDGVSPKNVFVSDRDIRRISGSLCRYLLDLRHDLDPALVRIIYTIYIIDPLGRNPISEGSILSLRGPQRFLQPTTSRAQLENVLIPFVESFKVVKQPIQPWENL